MNGAKLKDPYRWSIAWNMVLYLGWLHLATLRGLHYVTFTSQPLFYTFLWVADPSLLMLSNMLGVTAGAHRLWSHRSYKATLPLRTLLMVLQTMTFQLSLYEWARNHRVHHKFMDTDADPHNIKRGFFFAHLGCLMVHKHPDVHTKGRGVDLSDLKADRIVMFQKRYYYTLAAVIAFAIPTAVPWLLWGEDFWTAWYLCTVIRIAIGVHMAVSINSVAHTFGTRPYDRSISPADNPVCALFTIGEGWHNYHHTFPWDYKAAELGSISTNAAAAAIEFFSKIGWAYDLKTVSKEIVHRRMRRTGYGSHAQWQNGQWDNASRDDGLEDSHGSDVWGWGDKDMSQADILAATVVHGKFK